jgi:hypothetical protein
MKKINFLGHVINKIKKYEKQPEKLDKLFTSVYEKHNFLPPYTHFFYLKDKEKLENLKKIFGKLQNKNFNNFKTSFFNDFIVLGIFYNFKNTMVLLRSNNFKLEPYIYSIAFKECIRRLNNLEDAFLFLKIKDRLPNNKIDTGSINELTFACTLTNNIRVIKKLTKFVEENNIKLSSSFYHSIIQIYVSKLMFMKSINFLNHILKNCEYYQPHYPTLLNLSFFISKNKKSKDLWNIIKSSDQYHAIIHNIIIKSYSLEKKNKDVIKIWKKSNFLL